MNEEKIEAYIGSKSSESIEDRKEIFKERHTLQFISDFTRDPEKVKDIQIKIYKFIDENYSEKMPWSSMFFHINPYHFLEWFIENEYEGEI